MRPIQGESERLSPGRQGEHALKAAAKREVCSTPRVCKRRIGSAEQMAPDKERPSNGLGQRGSVPLPASQPISPLSRY
jgi:hypothetical protein